MFKGEYIGRQDKNGKDIHEGDPIKYQIANSRDERMYLNEVYYSQTRAAFVVAGFIFSQIYFSNLEIVEKG